MRIFLISIFSLFVVAICFSIIKLWGQSQTFSDYRHPLLSSSSGAPIEFQKAQPSSAEEFKVLLKSAQNLFLDVAVTMDQKLVLPLRGLKPKKREKSIRYSNYDEVKNEVLLLQDYKSELASRRIIFNLIENAHAVHEIFFFNMEQLGLEKGENFIVTSPYEAPIKALKELAPSFLFGSTQPEILKIVAMASMHLQEAASIRADIIIHPLKIRQQSFFTNELLIDFKRRFKRIIIGPIISPEERKQALQLNPFGIIVQVAN